MNMEAGPLRHWVTLQRPTIAQDPNTGEEILGWEDVRTVPAAVEPLSAREFIQSGATQAQITARIRIRYDAEVEPTWRIVQNLRGKQKVYGISGLLPDLDSGLEYLTIPVTLGPGNGR